MSTVVAVMDRSGWDANTDVVVLVEPARRRLVWIPRDLWCSRLDDRLNAAFKRGGHAALRAALAEHGLRADHGVCLDRAATKHALSDVTVRVPVARAIAFRYGASPEERVQDSDRVVRFDPPHETLSGERVHQWLGARWQVGRASSELDRLARQQTLLRALLGQGFDFAAAVANPEWVSLSDSDALAELRAVDASWSTATLSRVRPARRAGKAVLIRYPWWRPSLRGAWFRAGWPGRTLALRALRR
jgi:hypothetical protein